MSSSHDFSVKGDSPPSDNPISALMEGKLSRLNMPNGPWLEALNPPQLEAATTLEGPLLVLSGAGTGKTRVLTARMAQLIATRTAMPWNILAVTFTNKAAKEMKQRISQFIDHPAEQIMLGTFHSVAARMLRRNAELVGLKSDFTILGSDDQNRLVKQIMEAEKIDTKYWPPRVMTSMISRWKDRGLIPEKISNAEIGDFADGRGVEIYKNYQSRLLSLNAVDFGDLLLHMLNIFQSHNEVLSYYHSRLTHIMVDEYQDTNVAQYLWLRLLAAKHQNLCCVGDDDQSIYGWRGAEIGNILKFEKHFPTAKTVKLEQNYRSTGHILAAASTLIAHNENRLSKTLFTSDDKGEKLLVSGYWDAEDEARNLSARIESLIQRGDDPNEFAILVRAGFQTREFEERFLAIGLPYKVVGTKFYERAEIRDAMAYLRLINQPADDLAFERIINTPKRGLGPTTLLLIHRAARAQKRPLLAVAASLCDSDDLPPQAKSKLSAFCAQIAGWYEQKDRILPAEFVQMILNQSGYIDMWKNDKAADSPGRLENLKELITAIEAFDNLGGFLEHISLVMDNDSESSEGAVSLMTLHAAKGLEFDTVFLPGWEEELFPHPRSLKENGAVGLEEERRLAYVGLTRARKNIYASFVASRRVYGMFQSSLPSRFLQELPAQNIKLDMENGFPHGDGAATQDDHISEGASKPSYGPGWHRMGASKKGLISPAGGDGGKKGPQADTIHHFGVGDRVFHQKFGMGTIKTINADKLEVDFDNADLKKVIAGFVVSAAEAV